MDKSQDCGSPLLPKKRKRFEFSDQPKWFQHREMNVFPRTYSMEDDMKRVFYSSLGPVGHLPDDSAIRSDHGGIFGMDFSPDGSVLVAACERKAILLMNPLSRRMIGKVENAHGDCVNTVKFLDERLFATCSDDQSVKIWDLRRMKGQEPVRVLKGHTKWVKNIEYIHDEGILLTSGFDNVVYSWQINRYSDNDTVDYQRVLQIHGLIRMCLTKDCSKLIISTEHGLLFVVHNLDIQSLPTEESDFRGRPPILRINTEGWYEKKNITEIIGDFPKQNKVMNITSLIAHPQGWCVVSRNTNSGDTAEWTCVHDVQVPPVDDFGSAYSPSLDDYHPSDPDPYVENIIGRARAAGLIELRNRRQTMRKSTGGRPPGFLDPARIRIRRLPRIHHRLAYCIEEPNVARGFIKEQSFSADGRLIVSPFGHGVRLLAFDENCSDLSAVSPFREHHKRMWKNEKEIREERNKLRFSEYEPCQLRELAMHVAHNSAVLCAKFSPMDYSMATGCYNGHVAFYQPIL